jgi:hypothetical protein
MEGQAKEEGRGRGSDGEGGVIPGKGQVGTAQGGRRWKIQVIERAVGGGREWARQSQLLCAREVGPNQPGKRRVVGPLSSISPEEWGVYPL